jgi:hypothetical protein
MAGLDGVTSLQGLDAVRHLGGRLELRGMPLLTSLEGAPAPDAYVGGRGGLRLVGLAGLRTLCRNAHHPLPSGLAVWSRLRFFGASGPRCSPPLPVRVAGSISVLGAPFLIAPFLGRGAALGSVVEVGGDFDFAGLPSLTSLGSSGALVSVMGSVRVADAPLVTSLMGLDHLAFIGGDLVVGSGLPSLIDLTALARLHTVEGRVAVFGLSEDVAPPPPSLLGIFGRKAADGIEAGE